MDENIKKQLEQISSQGLQQVVEWAKATGDFVKEQAPLLVQEIIKLGYIDNIVLLVFSLAFGVTAWFVLKYCRKMYAEADSYHEDGKIFINGAGIVISILTMIVSSVCIINAVYMIAYIYFCPRVYLLEYLGKFINGTK